MDECQDRNLWPPVLGIKIRLLSQLFPRCVAEVCLHPTPPFSLPTPGAQPHSPGCGIGALLVTELAVSRTLKKTYTSFIGYIIHSCKFELLPLQEEKD